MIYFLKELRSIRLLIQLSCFSFSFHSDSFFAFVVLRIADIFPSSKTFLTCSPNIFVFWFFRSCLLVTLFNHLKSQKSLCVTSFWFHFFNTLNIFVFWFFRSCLDPCHLKSQKSLCVTSSWFLDISAKSSQCHVKCRFMFDYKLIKHSSVKMSFCLWSSPHHADQSGHEIALSRCSPNVFVFVIVIVFLFFLPPVLYRGETSKKGKPFVLYSLFEQGYLIHPT